jgi:hypothetical protein
MSKLGKLDWIFLYILAGFVDVAQIIIDLTGIGIAVSTAAEPVIGVFLIGYLQIRGFSVLKHPSILVSLIGAVGLGAITGGIAPAWVVDIWWIQRVVKKEKAQYEEQQEQEETFSNNIRRPLYDPDGIRRPQIQNNNANPSKLNIGGVRPPMGGLK